MQPMIVFKTLAHTNITINSGLWPSFFPLNLVAISTANIGQLSDPPSASGAGSVRSVEATSSGMTVTAHDRGLSVMVSIRAGQVTDIDP
jgi:hypothetical protein